MTIKDYLKDINRISFTDLESRMHEYAHLNKVPIIQDEGLALLRQLVQIKSPKKILEIGTAIGFSAINMARFSDSFITSIEISKEMYEIALANIKEAGYQDRINVINGDALLVDIDENDYDMIFIDAAKGQYIKFFEKFKNNLRSGGVIVTDNLLFHGLVIEEIESRNLRQLVKKIKNYNEWVLEQADFHSYIYEIGDGIAISVKKA